MESNQNVVPVGQPHDSVLTSSTVGKNQLLDNQAYNM